MDDEYEWITSVKLGPVMEFRRSLSRETDRGCALMAAECLSDQLSELLRAHFVEDRKVCDRVFDGMNGALSTFSSRIEFAYLLGHIGVVARRELHLIRKIRNEFAHGYRPLAFADEGVAVRCHELRAHVLFPDPSPRVTFVRSIMGLLAIIHASLALANHATAREDIRIEMGEDEQKEIKDRMRQLVVDLVSNLAPESASDEGTSG